MVLTLPAANAPYFSLGARGAVNLALESDEARYGVTQAEDGQRLTISLGATRAAGALALSMAGGQLPRTGTYAVRLTEQRVSKEPHFEALFVAGTAEHPVGVFRAESGSITITQADGGRIAGVFEIKARGFVAQDPENEDQWVTLRGRFEAPGDSAIVALRPGSARIQ
jgi:hypothetical protein